MCILDSVLTHRMLLFTSSSLSIVTIVSGSANRENHMKIVHNMI